MITGLIYNPPSGADPLEFQDLSCKTDNEQAVRPNPLEFVLGAEKRFSATMHILLDKKSSPLGIVVDFAVKRITLAHPLLGSTR